MPRVSRASMQRHQEASHLASLVQDVSACGLDVLLVVIGPITSVTTAGHAEVDHAEAGCPPDSAAACF
ncbi:hypothetical protein QBC46DRAFT_344728 [Diplogelasinospora grovesii]|uniref:Uncharacterized protein n=1 Tax=Diplogelasinospora grovesii TaxID=303347 RepID=A0AAN6N4I5_9PEZI|nr:hypothetical protein QBC46DRAFT_344728 [Diplogelasinospora grovesii]